jgi:hypothetical protein
VPAGELLRVPGWWAGGGGAPVRWASSDPTGAERDLAIGETATAKVRQQEGRNDPGQQPVEEDERAGSPGGRRFPGSAGQFWAG